MSDKINDGPRYAFVTLLTTDSYLPGALVLAHTLRRTHSLALNPAGTLTPADIANLGPAGLSNHIDVEKKVDLVCLVTPATVSVKSVKALVRAFDKVVGVEPLSFAGFAAAQINEGRARGERKGNNSAQSKAARKARAESRKKLALLGRPDLGEAAGAALTKLHAWRLTGYDKVIFLDADILVLRPIAHLFSMSSSLAASPDIGWPDAFNSGLLVLTPSLSTFSDIRDFAISRGSWDGADQGLLNDYFGGDEASGEIGRGGGWQRLPFRYNVTPNAGYTFAPAYERYGKGIMTAHFIGQHKPWNRVKPSRPSSASSGSGTAPADYDSLLLRWHEAYEEYYPGISAKQLGSANVIHTERGVEVVERPFTVPTYTAVWDAESDLMLSGSDLSSSSSNRRGSNRVRGVRSKSSVSSLLRGAGQAEELRGMFQGNVVDASVAAEVAAFTKDSSRGPNEGIYISLPLDGRTSLMGVEMDSGAEDSPDSDQTIDAEKYYSSQYTQSQSHDSQGQHGSGQWSPPKMSWDPAKEPPPMGGGSSEYQMRIPVDAFYINAWDQASQPKGKAAFFDTSTRPSTEPHTLARLQREHYFDNLGSDRPDPSLVKAVFPWEAKQSQTSSRIFPDEPNSVIPGSRGLDASLEAGSASPGETSSETSNTGQTLSPSSFGTPTTYQTFSPSASSHKGLPPTLSYTNAWDQMGGGSRNEGRSRSGSNKAAQVLTGDSRSSRSTQTPTAIKNRNRGGGQTEGGGVGSGSWEGQHHSHRQFSSGGGSSGSGMGQGVRDASADQSADGDNESSSSSSDEEGGTSDGATGTKWRRKGPGPGYQRKAERHSGQFGGGGPRSPRGGQPTLASGVGGGGSSKAGGGGETGVGIGATSMAMNRSRSSSSSSNTPHAFIPSIGGSSMTNRQRSRPEDALPYIEDEETMPPPSLDMSLSTAYQGSTYNQLSFPSFPQINASTHLQWLSRNSPTSSLPNSAQNSGSNSPTGTYTPFSQSPVASRSDLRQMARTHSQLQQKTTSRSNRRLLD